MSIVLKRIRLEEDLKSINAGEGEFTREVVLRLMDSFEISVSPFDEEDDFRKDWDSLYRWMQLCAQMAEPFWLDVLYDFAQSPPAIKDVVDAEEYVLSFNMFLEFLADKFPEKAKQLFGPEIQGLVVPD